MIDGVVRDIVDVLSDADLAPLVSHEGVIGWRQPGVAQLQPLTSGNV
jgi:hypothetical protein